MSKLRHNNPSQLVKEPGLNPILRDEPPHVAVLNRPSKNAYDYASSLSKILSYGGTISFLKSSEDSMYVNFKLYEVVQIIDSETIRKVTATSPKHGRYGMVLVEIDSEGYYTVCTFCPNLVLPEPHGMPILDVVTGAPTAVYADNTQLFGISLNKQSMDSGYLGYHPIAKVTGERSIFFSGILRSLVQ